MQSGVGNVPNAVMAGLLESKFTNIQAWHRATVPRR